VHIEEGRATLSIGTSGMGGSRARGMAGGSCGFCGTWPRMDTCFFFFSFSRSKLFPAVSGTSKNHQKFCGRKHVQFLSRVRQGRADARVNRKGLNGVRACGYSRERLYADSTCFYVAGFIGEAIRPRVWPLPATSARQSRQEGPALHCPE